MSDKYEWQFAPGTEIGPYTVVEPMAVGGMGEVYVARHSYLASRTVALKVLQFLRAQKDDFKDRFRAEASLLADLDHPNVVRLFDAGMTGNTCWMAMELLVGKPLDALARALGAMSVPNALYILAEVGDGVQAAHEVGVIHRDLKPANIFVTSQHGVKVLDFGTSKFHDRGVKTTDKMRLLGTYAYMSPEHLLNSPVPDHRTDIFAMGLIGCEMLLGRHPYADADGGIAESRAIGERILAFEPPVLHTLIPDVPDYVSRIFQVALARDRDARFPAVVDFVRELRAARKRYLAERGVPENAFHLASEEGRRREYTPPLSLQQRPPEPALPSRRVYAAGAASVPLPAVGVPPHQHPQAPMPQPVVPAGGQRPSNPAHPAMVNPQSMKTEVLDSPFAMPQAHTAVPVPLVQRASGPIMGMPPAAAARTGPLAYASTAPLAAPLDPSQRQSAPRIEGTPAPMARHFSDGSALGTQPSGSQPSWMFRAVLLGSALGILATLGTVGFMKLRGRADPAPADTALTTPEKTEPTPAAPAATTDGTAEPAPTPAAPEPAASTASAAASAPSAPATPTTVRRTILPPPAEPPKPPVVATAQPAAQPPAPVFTAPPPATAKPVPKPKTEVLPKSDL